ncbi:MAG: YIP1 family protein [Oscillospiraceae bacterium]|nr:YIP1 family protein [Oscillospiraceae bacterium]
MVYDMTPIQWLKHVIFHPTEGYEDMRWKKQGSMVITVVIVFFLLIAQIVNQRMGGFAFNMAAYSDVFNIVPIITQSVIIYITWVVANWSFCTLLDGEGNMRRIAIYTAYALVPYIVCTIVSTLMTYFLTLDESIWSSAIFYVGIGWTAVLLVTGMKACHQYSYTKTFVCIVLTLVGMLLILCLFVLLLSLFQQVYVFFYTIYTELLYRVRS